MARLVGILGLLIIILTGVACKQQTSRQTTNKVDKVVEKKSPTPQKTTVQKKKSWPFIKENETVEISPELITKNYYVVLDCSGSMGDSGCSDGNQKLSVAKQSLKKFVDLVPADANLGLLVFQNGEIRELIPLGKGNRNQFTIAVDATRNSGGTPLFSAIKQGYFKLEAQGKKQMGYGEYTLVIVTDGDASSGEDPTKIVKWVLDYSPIQIHTIGFCIGPAHSLNIKGRTVYKAANNPGELDKGLKDVLAESENFDISEFNLN